MRYVKWVAGAAFVVFLLAFSLFKIDDPDTLQYLANGKLVFSHGLYANFCAYNYVPHACQLAYAHEWLFSVITYATYLLGHWNGLELLQVAIILATFGAVVYLARTFRYSVFSTSFFIFLAVLVGMERFMLRADLFGTLLAVLFYVVLRLYIENKLYERSGRHKYLPLLLLFTIQLIWANSHGSFVLAFVIVCAYIAAYVVQYLVNKYNGTKDVTFLDKHVKALLTVLLITLVASILNPYGPRAFFDAFNGSTAISSTIQEWQSPFAPSDYHNFSVTVFVVVLCVATLILLANARKLYLADVFIVVGLAILSVKYKREIALFAVFCAMILPYYLDNLISYCRHYFEDKPSVIRGIAFGQVASMVVLIGFSLYFIHDVTTDKFYVQDNRTRVFGMGLSENQFPIHAADFIAANNLKGNMFNDYNTGEYLNWSLYPTQKTFVDAYTFSKSSLNYYQKIMSGDISYNEVAKQYHINYFVLNHTSYDTASLISMLYTDKAWRLVYFDELSVIFVANTHENQALINTYGIDINTARNYDPGQLPTYKDPVNFPYGFISRGLLLNNIGLVKAANYEFQKAISLGTYDSQAYSGLGVTDAQLGQNNPAHQAFQKAISMAPNYAPNRYNLGLYYFTHGQYNQALQEFNKTLSINSKYQNANLAIGLTYMKQGDAAKAKLYLQRELALYPHSTYAQKALNSLPQ